MKNKTTAILLVASATLWCLGLFGALASLLVWVLISWETAWPIGLAALLLIVLMPIIYSWCYRIIRATRRALRNEQPQLRSDLSALRKRI